MVRDHLAEVVEQVEGDYQTWSESLREVDERMEGGMGWTEKQWQVEFRDLVEGVGGFKEGSFVVRQPTCVRRGRASTEETKEKAGIKGRRRDITDLMDFGIEGEKYGNDGTHREAKERD
ncbi:hypothetical protein Vi05172_g3812 [Venturia inaequalis]|nr:hypothetical protein Vi05172_g3812 [Venturia inaequalis]